MLAFYFSFSLCAYLYNWDNQFFTFLLHWSYTSSYIIKNHYKLILTVAEYCIIKKEYSNLLSYSPCWALRLFVCLFAFLDTVFFIYILLCILWVYRILDSFLSLRMDHWVQKHKHNVQKICVSTYFTHNNEKRFFHCTLKLDSCSPDFLHSLQTCAPQIVPRQFCHLGSAFSPTPNRFYLYPSASPERFQDSGSPATSLEIVWGIKFSYRIKKVLFSNTYTREASEGWN